MRAPHPDSVVSVDGRTVALKVHRCLWSGDHPANSLAAITECARAMVARAEIDVQALQGGGFAVLHDDTLDRTTTGSGPVFGLDRGALAELRLRWRGTVTEHRPALLADAVEAIRSAPPGTIFELDLKDLGPWPAARVEEFVRTIEPIRERVLLGTGADWNLRRIHAVDPALPLSFNPDAYLDWLPGDGDADHLPRGAYGYLDRHPLAGRRDGPVADYLTDRFGGLARLVPGARELHVRLELFERMLDDAVDAAGIIHAAGSLVDVWTLDAGSPGWQARLQRVLRAGVDLVTTNTAVELAAAARADGR